MKPTILDCKMQSTSFGEKLRLRVSLFIPCLVEAFHSQVGESTGRILSDLGIAVSYRHGQTCCGQPLFKSGHWKVARKVAKHFLEIFENAECIVAPSGSCVSMVRNYYPKLLRNESIWCDRAMEIGTKVYELTEFLVKILHIDDLGVSWNGRAVYHDSCQVSRALGVYNEPRVLLSRVRGLELVEMTRPDLCCGFGGVFSLQFPLISEAMLKEKVTHILATEADAVISAEISCLMNIGGYLEKRGHKVRALHIAEVLDNR